MLTATNEKKFVEVKTFFLFVSLLVFAEKALLSPKWEKPVSITCVVHSLCKCI
jgi:hypothetical protein